MGAIDKFRAVFGDMDIRSVHHNVARLDSARAFLKSEDLPPERRVDRRGAGAAAEVATSWTSGQR